MPSSLLIRAVLKSTVMPTWACRRSRSCGTGRCARGRGGHGGGDAPETPTCSTWAGTHGTAREVPVQVTGLGTAVLNFASRGWDVRPPDGLSTWFSCPEGTLSPAAAM